MGILIRAIDQDRVDDYGRAVATGFHEPTIDAADLERLRERWIAGRWWAALDDEAIVATVRSLPLLTTMPGGASIVSCGLTAVTTRATHRRRGLMSEMITSTLRSARESGEPLSTLIAAEWPIYGRFGFGPATEHATYTLKAAARWTAQGAGTVELVDGDTLCREAPGIYDRHQAIHASEIDRDAFVWRTSILGPASSPRKDFRVICRDGDGVPGGYARYAISGDFDGRQPAGVLTVAELIAPDPATELQLWQYLCGIDWITTVKAPDRVVGERLMWWLADGRDLRQTERNDFVWARPLDVAACLEHRSYQAPAGLVIEVVDPLGLSGGRYRLDADPAGATCTSTGDLPDLTLPMASLGAILFGGHPLSILAEAGLASEHTAGAVAAATVAFGWPSPPWSASWF